VRPNETVTYGILKPEWVKEGVPTVRVTEMKTGVIDIAALPHCNPVRAAKFEKTRLVPGDLLVSKDGTIGKTAFVPPELAGGNITQHMLRFPITDLVDRFFVRLIIDAPFCQAWMVGETKGVALQGVNVGDFRRMPIPLRQSIWKVGANPSPLPTSSLPSEKQLEEMIVAAPAILDDQWMLIGRQIQTGSGGVIDLLAVAPDGSLVLIELKRDRTPREVVAQALDYASYVAGLKPEGVADIYSAFAPGRDLAADFKARFGETLDEDTLNESHQIVVVAASLDDSTERIVGYLSERDIPINVLFFQVFADGEERLLSRAWLINSAETQANAVSATPGTKEPWNGEFYVNFGHGLTRAWNEAVQYGFISGGGGSWYSGSLSLLNVGDRIWVKAPKHGFVGVGRVTAKSVRAIDFKLPTAAGDQPALEVLKGATYHREFANDLDRSEYFVAVRWLDTVPLEKAAQEVGFFGNQNTVVRPASPKWRHTIERLKQIFTKWDSQ